MSNGLQIPADVVTEMTWNYVQDQPALARLYEKGKVSQWNATTDIDWTPEVNFGEASAVEENLGGPFGMFTGTENLEGSLKRFSTDTGRTQVAWEFQSWMVSQFMHGEQGALVATARLVETVPDIDAKYYAANQVADEARHVEAYARYLNTKLQQSYDISAPLQSLLTDIMGEKRWDITYLGMQILVEGLALAAFGLGNVMFRDPIIKQITDYVMRDEARHVAFGVLALQDLYPQMSSAELADREEFLLDATQLMYDRFLLEQVWERLEVPVEEGKAFAANNPLMVVFRQILFSKIVPNLNKLGLLTPRVREHFEKLQIIQFEHAPDSATELEGGSAH
ncbi:MAG TPA: ferritin-like domain-containing protein [Acidimicrobiales bacterium]|nr:ferritin-like domain-containing protein [Acidimicrobiales bacterium]